MTQLSRRNSFLFLLAVAVAALLTWIVVARRAAHQPLADHPRLAPGVVLRDVTFYSDSLGRNMQYRVFVPESSAGQKLPVVYLLHGGGGSFRDWSNYSDVARFAARGLLL